MKLNFPAQVKQAQEDIEWYFLYSSQECHELSSNWSSMVSAACFGGSTSFHDSYQQSHFAAIAKKRHIHLRLSYLSTRQLNILKSTFAHLRQSPQLQKHFHKSAGAALHSPLALPLQIFALINQQELSPRTLTTQDRQLLNELKIQAEIDYKDAIYAYTKTYQLTKE